jgi:hypothetical protein
LGLELFHVDIIKDGLSFGVGGQMSAYWDFHDNRVFWDPSAAAFLQGPLDVGPRYSAH